MRKLFVLILVGVGLALQGCAPSIQAHRRLESLTAAALSKCQLHAADCAAALLCANAAQDAGAALQAARRLAASGTADGDATARSLALPVAAEVICERLGVKAPR